MSTAGQRLVLVLGMHRSGTSTLTRALEVLGVDLGSHLLPPAPGDNEKGYFEDAEVHALNHELLAQLGHDWHTLAPVRAEELTGDVARNFAPAAEALLASRFAATGCYGLKDPRINRLLPFWQPIFAKLGLRVSYVVCCRNPLSVARSLVRRDGFDPVKVHYLWLEHTVDALSRTAGLDRVVVDYDDFLDAPRPQLARLAARLGLSFDPEGEPFATFRRDFLVESMRHTRFTQADLERDPGVPPGVAKLFGALSALAADALPADGGALDSLLGELERTGRDLAPALAYMRRYEESSRNYQLAHADAERRAAEHVAVIRDRDVTIAGLVPAVQQRDAQIASLTQAGADARTRAEALAQAGAALEGRVADLQARVAQSQARCAELEASVSALSGELAAMRASLAQSEARAAGLVKDVADRDARHAAMVEASRLVEAQNAALERELEGVRGELARTQAELADLLATTWQVPKPSRIARLLRAKASDR